MKRILILLLVVALGSCEKEFLEADALGDNASIVGTWVETGTQEDILHLTRQEDLDPALYGFIIGEDGSFVERKNSGWCATPPITYENFEGTWKAVSDSLLEITVGYWGGSMTYQMRIISLSGNDLAIRFLYAENRADSR